MKILVITILYFASCPYYLKTEELVKEVLKERNLTAKIELIEVSEDEIYKYHFLGSPTVQINGKDIEPARRNDKPVFSCRFYSTENGMSPIPDKKMINDAIDEALGLKPNVQHSGVVFKFKQVDDNDK